MLGLKKNLVFHPTLVPALGLKIFLIMLQMVKLGRRMMEQIILLRYTKMIMVVILWLTVGFLLEQGVAVMGM